ncbi:hypothetical protein HYU40_02095 [Candidatus Woesearchaeota archaeon]|nr:hypothetical protein [Candidatus Woesearchaeota archaeon]
MRKGALFTVAIILGVAVLLVIGGCTKQQQQTSQPAQTTPQQEATPPQQQTQQPPAQAQQPQPAASQPLPQDDLYKDNLDQAVDDLSQLE